MCVFLSIVLAVAFFPLSSYASNYESSTNAQESPDVSSIPSEEDFEDASENQLIVTYADDALGLCDQICVSDLDEASLEEVALSDADIQTTLSDMGAIDSDLLVDQRESENAEACSLLTFEDDTDLQEVAAQMLSCPEVVEVQPNYTYELFSVGSTSYYDASGSTSANHVTDDPYSLVSESAALNQNYIYTTKIADAWARGYRSNEEVSIAVIDSGVRCDHPDLQSVIDTTHARDFTSDNPNGSTYDISPSYWTGKTGYECHGTWVSGILGAAANNGQGIAGTSYNAHIIPIKVTDGETLYSDAVVRAYKYLDNLIESNEVSNLKVINLSMGGSSDDALLKKYITHMSDSHNVLTVAASGNNSSTDHLYPADYSNVLSVMSVNSDLTKAKFSSYGDEDVSAPGVNITTTIPYSGTWSSSSEGKYSKSGMSGTSFSAPIAAGVAAICYAVKPTATASEVRYSIISGADSLKSIDKQCAPYLNALGAVKALISGKGLYEATHTAISSAKVASITAKVYTGKQIKPSPKITLNGKTLKRGTDYTLSYSNNKKPGKATITIKAIGAYKGSKKVTFKISPKASKILKLKAGRGSITVKWKRQKSSASGYQIRYSTSSARNSDKKLKRGKTVTISGKSRYKKKLTALKSKTRYYVEVRTYKTSNNVRYHSKWSALKKVTTK